MREPAFDREQRFEALNVGFRRLQLGRRRAHIRLGGIELRLRLADLLGPGAGLEQPELRDRLIAFGLRPANVQLGIGRAQSRDQRPDLDPIALCDLELDDPAADFRRHANFGRFNVSRGARRRLRAAVAACRAPLLSRRRWPEGRRESSKSGAHRILSARYPADRVVT